jgi:putative ABC transport system ATP-binding protein
MDDNALTQIRRPHIGFVPVLRPAVDADGRGERRAAPSVSGENVDRAWFAALVEKVGLAQRLGHRPSELSGGQQQRVTVARALISRPTVVFADEPTGNLAARSSSEILALLRETCSEDGQTIVMVTHDPRAAEIADRIPYVLDGRIVHDRSDQTNELGRVSAPPDVGLPHCRRRVPPGSMTPARMQEREVEAGPC